MQVDEILQKTKLKSTEFEYKRAFAIQLTVCESNMTLPIHSDDDLQNIVSGQAQVNERTPHNDEDDDE
jgi:hypothetical protein